VRERLGDRAGIVISTRNIAELYSINKEHRKAIEYFEKTLQSIDDESGSEMRGEILPKIGDEYLRFNDITNATTYLLRGLNHNRRINNKNGILKSLNSLANLNLKLKKTRLAESQLDRAFALTREVDNEEELLENYRLRITMDSLNRNFRKAFNWQNRYYDLKEKIDKKNAVPILIEEPEDLELPPQNVIIPEIISENGGAAKRQLKLIIYGLIVLIIIVTALLVGFLMNRRTKEAQLTNLRTKVKAFDSTHKSLLDKNKELEETNQAKDRLFSIVSHDLKDSITSIKAFLDLLKDDGVSKEEFDNLIPELSENANNASALLINLLNWSKSQMENLDPNPEEFNIQDVFSEKLHLIEKKVKEKRIVVLNESHKDMVYADKGMIGIVIQNLLANAVKFSKVGDVITVSNRDRNNNVLLCVEDTGVGISAEDQLKLFKASGFTTRGTAEEKGTGLGLSICKELVELNHGRIWVESEPNMGSKFFVELPRSKPGS
jgi:signal transduction histidine kinase